MWSSQSRHVSENSPSSCSTVGKGSCSVVASFRAHSYDDAHHLPYVHLIWNASICAVTLCLRYVVAWVDIILERTSLAVVPTVPPSARYSICLVDLSPCVVFEKGVGIWSLLCVKKIVCPVLFCGGVLRWSAWLP